MELLLLAGLAVALLVVAVLLFARRRFIEDGPGRLADTRSLGELIRTATTPVHIVFVHGMRANGPRGSADFRAALVRRLGGSDDAAPDTFPLNLGKWPREATLSGQPIWRTGEEWAASQPFVDRYRLTLGGGQVVIVDEVNWWPLLFPLKCRFLLLDEHHLSGGDEAHLKLCNDPVPPYHKWINDEEYRAALARPPAGSGALLNRSLKAEILNWGLADAVIALGPMRTHIEGTMQRAFALADDQARAAGAAGRVIISESLGSFAVLDSADKGPVKAYLEQTHDLYFFANQFALLELARIDGLDQAGGAERAEGAEGAESAESPAAAMAPAMPSSPLARLADWGQAAQGLEGISPDGWRPRQVIALSDPNDLLTYYVPRIGQVTVVNVLVRNARSWLGLFADPIQAHAGHAANPAVWDVLLEPRTGA